MGDEELLRRYVEQGDREALAEIVRRYGGMVLGVAQRVTGHQQDAEDVAQVCFAELMRKAGEVKVNLAGYLHCLATRRAIDLVRQRMARQANEPGAAYSQEATDRLWFEIKADLDTALAELDESVRLPLVQHYLLGRTQAQIAEELEVNQSTVARRLAAGLEQLRTRLGGTVAMDATLLAGALATHGVSSAPEAFITATIAKLAAAEAATGVGAVATTIGGLIMNKALVAVVVVAGAAVTSVVVISSRSPGSQAVVAPTTQQVARLTRAQEQMLYQAVDKDDLAAAGKLLAADARLARAKSGQYGETPLHNVRSVAMAQLLLDAGADGSARDREYGAHPVRWAANNWYPEVVTFLESKGLGDGDICYYVATGNLEQLTGLLAKDRQIASFRTGKEVLGSNRSLLHVAAQYGQSKVCELLIQSGADVAAEGGFANAQPLENAAWAGFTDTVKVLLEHGADANAQVVTPDQGTHTAIWWAALTGRKEIVAMLLDAGATVEPGLVDAVERSEQRPYPGRALPPRADYEAVIELLQKHPAVD